MPVRQKDNKLNHQQDDSMINMINDQLDNGPS